MYILSYIHTRNGKEVANQSTEIAEGLHRAQGLLVSEKLSIKVRYAGELTVITETGFEFEATAGSNKISIKLSEV